MSFLFVGLTRSIGHCRVPNRVPVMAVTPSAELFRTQMTIHIHWRTRMPSHATSYTRGAFDVPFENALACISSLLLSRGHNRGGRSPFTERWSVPHPYRSVGGALFTLHGVWRTLPYLAITSPLDRARKLQLHIFTSCRHYVSYLVPFSRHGELLVSVGAKASCFSDVPATSFKDVIGFPCFERQ